MAREHPSPRYQRIYAMVDSIPRGRVATYGQIAREAGLPRNARQVGYALRNLPKGSELPWHRVVNARGEISRRSDGRVPREQVRRLRAEGVEVDAQDRVDLRRFGWKPRW
jgi:methylated-DNA-protein-cysteine methyltransferase-like protein